MNKPNFTRCQIIAANNENERKIKVLPKRSLKFSKRIMHDLVVEIFRMQFFLFLLLLFCLVVTFLKLLILFILGEPFNQLNKLCLVDVNKTCTF